MLSEAVELMARDVFPAEVLLPDGSMLLGVRVFCTTKRTLVFRAAGGQISLAAELEHSPSCNITRDRSSLQGGRLQVETP